MSIAFPPETQDRLTPVERLEALCLSLIHI